MANKCVRQGASGSGSGDDWTNAYTTLPATLTRTNTYYIADGTYAGYSFDDSGTTTLTVKKATVADHGATTGWSDTYGDGTATFGECSLSGGGNLVFNGYNSAVANGRGIVVNFAAGGSAIYYDTDVNNITLQYLNMAGPNTPLTNCAIGVWATGDFGAKSGLTISHCAIHGTDTLIQTHTISNVIVEYCDLYDVYSTSACHGNVILVQVTNGFTFRYNKVYNWQIEGVFITYPGSSFSESVNTKNVYVYGNTFCKPASGDSHRAIETHQDMSNVGPILFYNNTICGCPAGYMSLRGGLAAGSLFYNNLFYGNAGAPSLTGLTHDYNAMDSANAEAHGVSNITSSVFTNYAASDYHIVPTIGAAYPRNKGLAVGAPYNYDRDGILRGGDGTYDIGAYEYDAGVSPPVGTPVLSVR